ncbi:hypothetical protein QE152_g9517 [Popillia japonica]|uniref:Endonuclease/exonuclease/phosphatase domain-containing protein n=1 Tax=Popillia japonica TaxID=7064 RepID=A0AAW1LWV8_POPJA
MVCGDFNVNFEVGGNRARDIVNLFESFNMRPLINEPTRITADSATLLDNIFTNVARDDLEVIIGDSGVSDHCYQLIHAGLGSCDCPVVAKFVEKRIYNHANISRFQSLLNSEDWSRTYSSSDPNVCFENFHNTFKYYFDIAFPK